jgi:hypothetical protein
VTVGEPAEDVIPIDPAILGKEGVSEENVDENVAPDFSGSLHPTSLTPVAQHGHAHIVDDPTAVSNTNSET